MSKYLQQLATALGELLGAGLVALAVHESYRRARWDLVASGGLALLRVAAVPELAPRRPDARRWVH